MKKLMEEFEFNGLKIKLFEEDFEHAIENHPGEVTLEGIRKCITQPDFIIESIQGKNGCLFYEIKMENDYFVVLVHVIGNAIGEIRTAYEATYIKKGKILFKKDKK
jgi:hypothetical protein